MTLLVLIKDDRSIEKFPYQYADLFADNPQVSFPEEVSEEILSEYNVYVVEPVDPPIITNKQRLIQGWPKYVGNVWQQVWNVENISIEELRAAISPVTRRQAKLALHEAGLLEQVEIKLSALEEPMRTIALINWQEATEFERNNEFIGMLGQALNLTEEQVDDLFALASTK